MTLPSTIDAQMTLWSTQRETRMNLLQATRYETLGDDCVARFIGVVVPVVEGARGDYDGWGAPVESPAPAP